MRYELETVPGVAEVATIGGFVRQYQVQLDPHRLLAYGIPLSTVIDRCKRQHERGWRPRAGDEWRAVHDSWPWILRSLGDLENVAVMAKNGTPVLLRIWARSLSGRIFARALRSGTAKAKPWAASS